MSTTFDPNWKIQLKLVAGFWSRLLDQFWDIIKTSILNWSICLFFNMLVGQPAACCKTQLPQFKLDFPEK